MNLRRLLVSRTGINICLEPEDCGFDSARFSGVKEEVARLREGQSGKAG